MRISTHVLVVYLPHHKRPPRGVVHCQAHLIVARLLIMSCEANRCVLRQIWSSAMVKPLSGQNCGRTTAYAGFNLQCTSHGYVVAARSCK